MSSVASRRTALRLLLLMLVGTGVVGMHTLGHPTRDGHGGAVEHSTTLRSQEPMVNVVGAALTIEAPHVHGHGTGMRLDPLTVCLAILVGGLSVLLLVLLAASRRRRMPDNHIGAALGVAGRGPPPCSRLGLRLADLSVLRT